MDQQVARFLYATNMPFHAVEHPEFKKMITLLRPGYQPPSRHDVAGPLLCHIHQQLEKECQGKLEGENVSMALDGWTNIRNEPIVCVCVTTSDGKIYPTMTVNTSGHSHTASYLAEVAKRAIIQTEMTFKCKVSSNVLILINVNNNL